MIQRPGFAALLMTVNVTGDAKVDIRLVRE